MTPKKRATTKTLNISLPPELIKRIKRAAEEDQRNTSNWVAHTLRTHLDAMIAAEDRPDYTTKPK